MTVRDSDRHLHSALEAAAHEDPDAPAVTFVGDATYSRAELLEATMRLAAGFRAEGVQPGDRVALFLSNRVEFLTSYFALSALGAVSVPLNTALRGDVLTYMLQSVSPCRLVTEAEFAGQISPALADSPGVDAIWSLPSGDRDDFPGARPLRYLMETPPLPESVRPQPWALASILFTSGTTGPSKGVMWSHNMAISFAENATWVMGYTDRDTVYTCLPLFHINALFTAFYAGLQERAPVVVSRRFSASSFWREIRDSGATVTNMLGAMGAILWRQQPLPEEKEHCLRLSMVVPFPTGYVDEFEDRFSVSINELYGSTDTGIPIGVPSGTSRPGSCGVPAPGWEVMLVDKNDEPVPTGELGELVTRPTRPFVGQLGYWGMPEQTWEAHRNLWFHTGDMLRQDNDGWYYFADRKKDAMRVSGENVSSFEVEQVLVSHPDVLEAAVYAVPSELGEDSVMAAVVVEPGSSVEPAGLLEFITPRLAYFAVPRYIDVLDSLPKTSTEKVRKSVLREQGVKASTWDAGPRRRGRN